jgi:hypothetical protein
LLYGAAEMFLSPEVAIIQHITGVMQVVNDYFENGITFFTNLVYTSIRYSIGCGEVAPFVGHNAFLRWLGKLFLIPILSSFESVNLMLKSCSIGRRPGRGGIHCILVREPCLRRLWYCIEAPDYGERGPSCELSQWWVQGRRVVDHLWWVGSMGEVTFPKKTLNLKNICWPVLQQICIRMQWACLPPYVPVDFQRPIHAAIHHIPSIQHRTLFEMYNIGVHCFM